MLIRNDLTGRKFVCLGTDEYYCPGWSDSFTVGCKYYECHHIEFDGSNILVEKNILFLHDDNGDLKFVDAKEFNEIDLKGVNFRIVIRNAMFSLN